MRKISLLVATIAAAAALCAACGGSAPATGSGAHRPSPDPAPAPAGNSGAAASLSSGSAPDACKLMPLAAVRAVLGDSWNSATSGSNIPGTAGYAICFYSSSSTINPVEISVFPTAYSSAVREFMPRNATPFDGLGHPAECALGGPVALAGQSSLVAAIGSDAAVWVLGPSCSADGKLAQRVYSALAS